MATKKTERTALHLGGELSGKTLPVPDDRLAYRPDGHSETYVAMQMPDGTEVWAEGTLCYRTIKTMYRLA